MATSKWPKGPVVLHPEHASVIYSEKESAATGKVMPKLEVQLIDFYRYQREWSIQFRHEPGNSKVLYWESHAYKHPGERHVARLSRDNAESLIARFLDLSTRYPALLFAVRGQGFVHFHDALLRGAEPSVKLLNQFV